VTATHKTNKQQNTKRAVKHKEKKYKAKKKKKKDSKKTHEIVAPMEDRAERTAAEVAGSRQPIHRHVKTTRWK